MKRNEYESRLTEIVKRLDEITEQDRAVIQPEASQPVTIPIEQLFAYGERVEERQRLHEELRKLASEPVED